MLDFPPPVVQASPAYERMAFEHQAKFMSSWKPSVALWRSVLGRPIREHLHYLENHSSVGNAEEVFND